MNACTLCLLSPPRARGRERPPRGCERAAGASCATPRPRHEASCATPRPRHEASCATTRPRHDAHLPFTSHAASEARCTSAIYIKRAPSHEGRAPFTAAASARVPVILAACSQFGLCSTVGADTLRLDVSTFALRRTRPCLRHPLGGSEYVLAESRGRASSDDEAALRRERLDVLANVVTHLRRASHVSSAASYELHIWP